MEVNNPISVGRAWIKKAWKPVYAVREIKRGKNKGRYEVVVRLKSGKNGYRKRIVSQIKEEQIMGRMKELVEEFNGYIEKHNITDIKPVKKFATIAIGERRLDDLYRREVETVIEDVKVEVVVDPVPTPTPSPEIRKKYPNNPDKFRPAIEACFLRLKLWNDNPEITRKEYLKLCEARGICRGSASRQWNVPRETLENMFKEII